MKNHKWVDISNSKRDKEEECLKCKMQRVWIRGYMQTWQYIDYTMPVGSNRTTLRRPQCEPNRGRVIGFYKDGSFIKPEI